MTITIKQDKINNYYLCLEQDKYSISYRVTVCPMIDDSSCGYPISDRIYATLQKAQRRYRDIKHRLLNHEYNFC